MNRFITIAAADWGPTLHRLARLIGAVLALLITLAWIATECAYDLGRQLRLALEERNDQLAAAWVAVLRIAREEAQTAAPVAAPAQNVTTSESIITSWRPRPRKRQAMPCSA